MPVSDDLVRTRRSLHRVAEHVLGAARHAAEGRIGLRVVPGGFGTPPFPTEHGPRTLAVVGIDLVVVDDRGERRRELTTLAAAAELAGIAPGMGADVYPLATDPDPELPLDVDRAAAAEVETWFMRVDEALRGFVTGRTPAPTVTLWPEHFDVATTVDEVNYGGSPGDDEHDTPYAYVGPRAPQDGVFWTEPFGASRLATDLPTAGAVLEFFREGEAHVAAPGKQPPP